MPADTNAAGDIFGGWLMSQVDIAGSIAAYRYAGGRVVTASVNDFHFLKPVYIGDLVSIFADIDSVGTTSMIVKIIAYAQRKRGEDECDRVATATLTFVALDENRKPRKVKQKA
ncbi:MAG: acyl-CoA thioesterase [Gammaproteobacteria bacterium]